MDEGLDKLSKIIAYKTKQASGQALSNQEKKDLSQFEGIAKSVFLQVKEGLSVIAEVSSWAPESFLFGGNLVNYYIFLNKVRFQKETCSNAQLFLGSTPQL